MPSSKSWNFAKPVPTSSIRVPRAINLLDGTLLNANSDTHVPIVSLDTSSQAPSSKYFVFSTPTFAYDYDPANLKYLPLWVTAKFANYGSTGQKMHWVKVYYTVP